MNFGFSKSIMPKNRHLLRLHFTGKTKSWMNLPASAFEFCLLTNGIISLLGAKALFKNNDSNTKIEDLKVKIGEFLRERDWEKYHNPKDLAESICIEAAELLQLFQWMNPEEVRAFKDDSSKVERLNEELADVIIYCLSMANAMNIDLASSVMRKLGNNRKKYPANLYRGKARL